MCGQKNKFIQKHPLLREDVIIIDSYDALMIRLHYLSTIDQARAKANLDRTLWLTTYVARQLIYILKTGIAKIESTDCQPQDFLKH
ncbi:MAG: biofilm formation regulator BssS [Candidatus Malihini olakiniferum]